MGMITVDKTTETINLNEMGGLNLLTTAARYGILQMDELTRQVEQMRTKDMLAQHEEHHRITQMSNGRWSTYVWNPKKGKQEQIRGASKEAVIEKLKNWYFSESHINNLTLKQLYEEWIPYKESITTSPNTIKKHNEHYNKYFKDQPFFNRKVVTVTAEDLEDFCNNLVKTDGKIYPNLWTNLKTILYGMFNYAVREYKLPYNPTTGGIHLSVKLAQVPIKDSTTEVFNTIEQASLKKYLDDWFEKTHDLSFLAIRVNLLLGLRIAELSTLKWEDIVEYNVSNPNTGEMEVRYKLRIRREETTNRLTREIKVEDHTKGYAERYLILVKDALDLFEKAKAFAGDCEWIFSRNGERLRNRQLEYVLDKYAERNGVKIKSSHKLRKTYASNLDREGVPLHSIQRDLGHKHKSTTEGYLFSTLTDYEEFQIREKALSRCR